MCMPCARGIYCVPLYSHSRPARGNEWAGKGVVRVTEGWLVVVLKVDVGVQSHGKRAYIDSGVVVSVAAG